MYIDVKIGGHYIAAATQHGRLSKPPGEGSLEKEENEDNFPQNPIGIIQAMYVLSFEYQNS